MSRVAWSLALAAVLALAAGCDDEEYGHPPLGGGTWTPGYGYPPGSQPDGGVSDGGGPDAGSYLPSCLPVGTGLDNQLVVDGDLVSSGNAFADYIPLPCPARSLSVVVTEASCLLIPPTGLYLTLPTARIGDTVAEGVNVIDLVAIDYFDGEGNRFCNDTPGTASGQLVFDAIGVAEGETVRTSVLDLTLPHCVGPSQLPDLALSGTVEVTVGRDAADACGP